VAEGFGLLNTAPSFPLGQLWISGITRLSTPEESKGLFINIIDGQVFLPM
jgi:hypothetical protein